MELMVGMGVESGGNGGRIPRSEKLGGDATPRFENEVAQIRCLFRFVGYFGGRLATLPMICPPLKNSWRSP